jgi:microcystin-dependent protein
MDNILIYGKDINTGSISQLQSINNVLLTNSSGSSMPISSIIQYAGSLDLPNWLICNGRLLDQEPFSSLYDIIGNTYGSGTYSLGFRLPDLRKRIPVGLNIGGTFDPLGATGGSETHTLTTSEMPAHTHLQYSDTTATNLAPPYSSGTAITNTNTPAKNTVQGTVNGNYVTTSTSAAATVGLTSSTGGDQAHNNLQPYIVLNYLIYTGTTTIPSYAYNYNNYINGPWYATYPSSTSGSEIIIPTDSMYVLNLSISTYSLTANNRPEIIIYINGSYDFSYKFDNYITEANSHKTLVTFSFKKYLTKGTNYVAFYLYPEQSDSSKDRASINFVKAEYNASCTDGIIPGPWSTVIPPINGKPFTIDYEDMYVINVNASAYKSSNGILILNIYLNGIDTGKSLKIYINNNNSHITLVPIYFKFKLNVGTNYLYLYNSNGISDSFDRASLNCIPVSNNVGCSDGYITGAWPIAAPTSTSGTAFTISITGTYILNVCASAWTESIGFVRVNIYINGISTGYYLESYINESESHKTLVPISFTYNLTKGTNYLYLQQNTGTSDDNDFASFSWAYTT